MRVVVLGGYGNFGARICRALSTSPDIALPIAGRDVARAENFDLVDGRRFVCDFPPASDAAFDAAGRTALTGASTVHALSSAVVHALTQGWQRLESIAICIAPARTAPRGVAWPRCGPWPAHTAGWPLAVCCLMVNNPAPT
ncbi:MAG: Saccharopine dehydrogenase-related protein [Rhodoferax sp.]|nr:Saccharopine dehydrogenase-related protein [Rhodoferax sp.]